MNKFLKESYLFLILFVIILLKEPIYNLFKIENDLYHPIKCEFLESDYNKLLEFNNIEVVYQSNYTNSYIIYKDIYNYMNVITIRGGIDQNFKNNPVIYDNTLIGIISKVNKNSSIVKLITNKDSKISVKINDFVGVLENSKGKLIVSNIPNYSNISIGDNIYTSGLGNIHENIFIGTVKNITLKDNQLEKIVEIDYKLNIKDIDYVTVLEVGI